MGAERHLFTAFVLGTFAPRSWNSLVALLRDNKKSRIIPDTSLWRPKEELNKLLAMSRLRLRSSSNIHAVLLPKKIKQTNKVQSGLLRSYS
jgi:hypothetical protein